MDLDDVILEHTKFSGGKVFVKKRLDPRLGTVFKKYLTSNNVWDDKFFLKDDPTVGRPILSPAVMLKASEKNLKQFPKNTDDLIKKGYALGGLGRFKDAIKCFDEVLVQDEYDTTNVELDALH